MMLRSSRREWWTDGPTGRTVLLLHTRFNRGGCYLWATVDGRDVWWLTDGRDVLETRTGLFRPVIFSQGVVPSIDGSFPATD